MNCEIRSIESNSFTPSDIESKDIDIELIALLRSNKDDQASILGNSFEFNKYASAFMHADISHLFKLDHLSLYLIHIGESLFNQSAHPAVLRFFFVVIEQIIKKGALPWSLLSGKSLLGHMKECSQIAPPEIGEYVKSLGADSIALFEQIIRKKPQLSLMTIDGKEKIIRLNQLLNDAYFLQTKGFSAGLPHEEFC